MTTIRGGYPRSPGIRHCCLLSVGPGGATPPFINTSSNCRHGVGAGWEKVGVTYTCSAGFIDLGHLRDLVDLTYYYYLHLARASKAILPSAYKGYIDLHKVPGTEDEAILLARSMAYAESVFHEIETYWFEFPGHHHSAFSPEDLVSNFLGTYVGERAIRAGGDFDKAVGDELHALLTKLGALDWDGIQEAWSEIRFRWVNHGTEAFQSYLKRRNFNVRPIKPALVPQLLHRCTTSTFPADLEPELPADLDASYEATYWVPKLGGVGGFLLKHKFSVEDPRQDKLGEYVKLSEFQTQIDKIKLDSKMRYGSLFEIP